MFESRFGGTFFARQYLDRWLGSGVSGAAAAEQASTDAATILDQRVLDSVVGPDRASARAVLDDFFASLDEDAIGLDTALDSHDATLLAHHAHRI